MIKVFQMMQIQEAREHAAAGGQSIHLHRLLGLSPPKCFVDAVARGEDIAHFFDQNRSRLESVAQQVGVRVVVVERPGTASQHIDLCGGPLARLLRLAQKTAPQKSRDTDSFIGPAGDVLGAVLPTLSVVQLQQVEGLMLDAITRLPVGSQRALNMHAALSRVRTRVRLVDPTPAPSVPAAP
jgi:hypothetical protein